MGKGCVVKQVLIERVSEHCYDLVSQSNAEIIYIL